jgi:hypothetical protein
MGNIRRIGKLSLRNGAHQGGWNAWEDLLSLVGPAHDRGCLKEFFLSFSISSLSDHGTRDVMK